jgi:hypothetical protein
MFSPVCSFPFSHLFPFFLFLLCLTEDVSRAGESDDLADVFSLRGEANIMDEEHFGIVNGCATVGIPYKDVAGIDGLWAPPFVSSDFHFTMKVLGRTVPTERYVWRPFEVEREGTVPIFVAGGHKNGTVPFGRQRQGFVDGLRVRTVTALVPGYRGGRMTITVENTTPQAREVTLQFAVGGTLDRTTTWEFARAASRSPTQSKAMGPCLLLEHGDQAITVRPLGGVKSDPAEFAKPLEVSLSPRGTRVGCVVFAVGDKAQAVEACSAIAQHAETRAAVLTQVPTAEKPACRPDETYRRRVAELFEKLPRLRSSNPALVRFYNRSLVHFLMNRWDVPEFLLRPYYGTGSVKGGCVCNYLWNFGEVWEILPLVDPAADREHIKQFLRTDMTKHFAFMPITGEAFGPWYPVNQEKIVGLVYYYVKVTGDAAFLREQVSGKSVLDHVIANAMYGDDPAKPVALIDYGPSNSHLELRRGYPYNHVMPDLNGRRYANYLLASQLAEVAGKPAPYLLKRAEALRAVLKQRLWDPRTRWFDFLDAQGRKDTRYTVQLFKLIASGVLDAEEEAGLLGHLNEREFLSQFGLHSMAKTDVAYDQVDIDNGGGGACTCFPPQIAERLYKAGRHDMASDILRRILWWGECLPYWGDSLVANSKDYRKDTPLQCTLDGVTVAQCILFGLFGVSAEFDGRVTVDPHPPTWAPRIELRGLKIRGRSIDILVSDGQYEVRTPGRQIRATIGHRVVVE